MHTEAPTNPGGGDELLHKFRLLLFELRELIADEEKLRYRLCRLPKLKEPVVIMNMIHMKILKKALSPRELTPDRRERSHALAAVQVCDHTEKMRKIPEYPRHSASLIVD